jgi:hypothetical protein
MNNLRVYRNWVITFHNRFNRAKWFAQYQGIMLTADSEVALHLKIEAKTASMQAVRKKPITYPSKERLKELVQMD